MRVERAIPFGRSFDEYTLMFGLDDRNRTSRILGVADGPASFNAEVTEEHSRAQAITVLIEEVACEFQKSGNKQVVFRREAVS